MAQPIPTTMRALVLAGAGFEKLSIQQVPVPKPNANQLLARVDAAGICTSLIKLVAQASQHSYLYGWDVETHPIILGDEGSVTIVEVGDNLKDSFRLGERFVLQPAIDSKPINHRERYNDVESVKKVAAGHTLAGHLAEYILITEEALQAGCLLAVPEGLAFAHAAMSEPISCCVSAQDHHVHIKQDVLTSAREVFKGLKEDGICVVIGAGAMGRMHVDVAMSYRPKAIIINDLLQERLDKTQELFGEKAAKLGIELYTFTNADEVQQTIDTLSDFTGADDVIVAVAVKEVIEKAQYYVGRYGVLNLFAGLKKGQDTIAVDSSVVHYTEINITGSSGGSPWDIAQTLSLMAAGELESSAHITRVGDLNHSIDFMQMIVNQELDGKAIVYPHRKTDSIHVVNSWTKADEFKYLKEGS